MRIPDVILSLAVLSLAAGGGGCSSDPIGPRNPDDYVVFGDFYGECVGEGCVDIFKIQDGSLYEDTLDRYPTASKLPHETSFMEIGNDGYDEISELLSTAPGELFDEEDVVIGQPDAGDWGGFYLEVRRGENTYYWLIDKMEDNLPPYLRSYASDLEEAIRLAQSQDH